MTAPTIRNFVDSSTGCTQVARPSKYRPSEGEVRFIFGKRFTFTGTCWSLDEVCENVITRKHAGSQKLYAPHPRRDA